MSPTAPQPRLLHVATSGNDGGLERYSALLAARLTGRGLPLRFACAPDGIVETLCRSAGVATLPLMLRNSVDWNGARALAAQIVALKIDIVHVHSRRDYVSAVLAVALARRSLAGTGRRPKLVLHAHMLRPLGTPKNLSSRFFLWGTDRVIANSRTVQDFLVRQEGLPEGFVRLLHNGVALDQFAAPPSPKAAALRRAARSAWEVPEDAPTLGMVGRLDAKGQAALLSVVPRVPALQPSLRVILIGSEGRPGERARLAALADAEGLAGRVVFMGAREDVPALLPGLDALVHLPADESFGLALVEAMATGLPVIATNIPACREIVQEGVTGRLVPLNDPNALADALTWLLDPAEGPARRAALGQAGRCAVELNFSLERQLDRLQALYSELYSE